ncbi:hypothetical protein RU639_012817 [Aspergillus parasiticus]
MQYFIDKARDAGIVVPITTNDASNNGYNALGTGLGAADIYGYDQCPVGVRCYNLYDWPAGQLNDGYWNAHLALNPSAPHLIAEFQAGTSSG